MNIQIIGTKKCKDTNKAIRFFKERGIQYHFLDISEKPLSAGELKNIIVCINQEELINKQGKEYKKMGFEYMDYNIMEELLEYPMLLKTPVVRNGKKAAIGLLTETWKEWIKES